MGSDYYKKCFAYGKVFKKYDAGKNVEELEKRRIMIFDLETTGFKMWDEIIELGYIILEEDMKTGNMEVIKEFDKLFRPFKKKIPELITNITHITNEMVNGKTCFYDDDEFLNDLASVDMLVGHNIVDFDVPFVLYQFFKRNVLFKGDVIKNISKYDTMIEARNLDNAEKYAKGYKLCDLQDKYDIAVDGELHRALTDCKVVLELFKEFEEQRIKKLKDEEIDSLSMKM